MKMMDMQPASIEIPFSLISQQTFWIIFHLPDSHAIQVAEVLRASATTLVEANVT
jgi:hypothetical protein